MAGASAECLEGEVAGAGGPWREGRETVAKLSPKAGVCRTDEGRLLQGKGVHIPRRRDHGDVEK